MRTHFVLDKESVSKRYRNQAGFLVLPDCVLARSGILEYSDVECEDGTLVADGALICVYRPPQALEECTSQFKNLPLTLEHPDSSKVDTENAKDVVIGTLSANPRFEMRGDDGYIVCDIVVYDQSAIDAIESGDYEELSAGYETCFKNQRGVTPQGMSYEAVQYLLIPNHVALVQRGRCGSECRVCDKAEKNNRREKMARKEKQGFRYFLNLGDGEEMIPVTAEQAEMIEAENPDLEVEEMDEEEFKNLGVETSEEMNEEENLEEGFEQEEENLEEEMNEDEDEEFEQEEETDEEENLEEEEKPATDELIYEVEFDDGTVGKMDEVAYKKVQRYLDVTAKGDARESLAEITVLTSRAGKILGESFDVANFVVGDKIDTARIKRSVIKKVLPSLVTRSLKGDALDRVYEMAVDTHKNNQEAWNKDVANLSRTRKADSQKDSFVEQAKKRYAARLNGEKK